MYYMIIGGDSKSYCRLPEHQFISFSKRNKGVCFGHTKDKIVPNYTLEDYIHEYGHCKAYGSDVTVLEYLRSFIPGLRNYRLGKVKNGFVYYADFDKARASEWMKEEKHLRSWARSNGVVLIN